MAKPRPGGLRHRFESTLERLPGGALVRDRVNEVEDQVLRGLKERMDGLDLPALPAPLRTDSTPPGVRLRALVENGSRQSADEARTHLFNVIVNQLVPDEARMLAAVSDGSHHPLIHVGIGPPVGPVLRVLMANVTNLPRVADVTLLEHGHHYVNHLRDLGLLETGPEDAELDVKYQVLQGDAEVRALIKEHEKESKMPIRYIRRVVRMSPLGKELWNAESE